MTLQFGDLLSSNAEVLVSSDDHMLSMGGGVSAAIAERAGTALELDAAKAVPCHRGDVVVTTAGALPARYVFHVVTIGPAPNFKDGRSLTTMEYIALATERCLDLLDSLMVSSIAFPALGTGTAGVSIEDSAVGMARAISSRLEGSETAWRVELILRGNEFADESDYISFFEVFAKRLPLLDEIGGVSDEAESRLSRHVSAAAAGVLRLEQDRNRIERELAIARQSHNEAGVQSLEKDLQVNTEHRVAAYDTSRRERAPHSVFVSYAHEDEVFKTELEAAMAGLRRQGLVRDWNDREIVPGHDWNEEIAAALEGADIALLLVSNDFLNSDYCTGVELARALERHRQRSLAVIPVIVRASDWTALLGELQALPPDGKPIASYSSRDDGYLDVVRGLRGLIEKHRRQISR